MTVTSEIAIAGPYDGNDVTVEFDYGFYIAADTELVVTLADTDGAETVQTLTTHYTVDRDSETGKGTFTMGTAPATGEIVSASLGVPLTQATNLLNKGTFHSEIHETAWDKLTRIAQQLAEKIDRCVKVGVTTGADPADVILDNYALLATLAERAPVLLDTATASASANLEVASADVADYDWIELEFVNVLPATDGVAFNMRVSNDAGSTWQTGAAAYGWKVLQDDLGGADYPDDVIYDASDAYLYLAPATGALVGNGASCGVNGKIRGYAQNALAITGWPYFKGELFYRDDSIDTQYVVFLGQFAAAYDLSGYQFAFSAGNIASGTIRLWGLPTGS